MAKGKVRKLPKTECCVSRKKCDRCPLRMLKEGSLPSGYTVKKRKLVRVDGKKVTATYKDGGKEINDPMTIESLTDTQLITLDEKGKKDGKKVT